MKKILPFILVLSCSFAKAQKIENIFVNLYTDSLKKGTFNYINIDGLLANGRYTPLDSTQLIFTASAGQFSGNSLWVDKDFTGEKINFKIVLRSNNAVYKEFTIFIKKKPDDKLKTVDELMNDMQKQSKTKRN